MLIKIIVEKKPLIIPDDSKIHFDLISPLFESDAIPGSVVYPFEVDGKSNDHIFKYARFVEVNRQIKLFDCTIFAGTFLICTGKLICKKVKASSYQISIIINSLAAQFSERDIKSLDYGPNLILCNPATPQNIANYATDVVQGTEPAPFTFPQVYNEQFYGDSNPDFGGFNGTSEQGKYINLYRPTGFAFNHTLPSPAATNIYALVPYLRLNWVLISIFKSAGYNTSGSIFSDPAIQKLLIANYYPLDFKQSKYGVTASITSIVLTHNDYASYFPSNIVDSDACLQYNYRYKSKYNGTVQITLRIRYGHASVLNDLTNNRIDLYRYWTGGNKKEQSFDLDFASIPAGETKEFTISLFCETAIDDLLTIAFFSSDPASQDIQVVGTITWTHIGYSNLNVYSNIIHYADHLPSVTVGSLVNALRNTLGLAVWFDPSANEIEFSFLDEVLNSKSGIDLSGFIIPDVELLEVKNDKSYNVKYSAQEVASLAGQTNLGDFQTFDLLPIPGKLNVIARVVAEKRFYIYKSDENNVVGWFFYSDDLLSVTVTAPDESTTEELNLEVSLSTLRTIDGRMTMESKQKSTSSAFDTGVNDFPLELCFDHGLLKDRNDQDYPFASPFNYDSDGNKILDASLDLYSEESLYVKHQKPWLAFLSNCEEVTESLTIRMDQFIQIVKLFSVQQGIPKRKVTIGNINYIPKSFSFEFDASKETITGEAILVKPGGFSTDLNPVADLFSPHPNDPVLPPLTPFYLGQEYQGGFIIFIDNTGLHGLICAPDNLGNAPNLFCRWFNGFNRHACLTLNGIGEGMNNTTKIINTIGASGWAASACRAYRGGGYSDWYLPSRNEAYLIYQNLYPLALGNLLSTDILWTSSEYDAVFAWCIRLHDPFTGIGLQTTDDDYNYHRVRPIRSF